MVFIVESPQNGRVRKEILETIQENGYRDLIYELSLVEGVDIVFLEALNQLRRADLYHCTVIFGIFSRAREGYDGR